MAQSYAQWAEEDVEPLEYLEGIDEPMPDRGDGTPESPPRLTESELAARHTRELRAEMRKAPFAPSEATRALAGAEPGEVQKPLGMLLRPFAERSLDSFTDVELRTVSYVHLADHLCLVDGHDQVCVKLQQLRDGNFQLNEKITELETRRGNDDDERADSDRARITALEVALKELTEKGAVPPTATQISGVALPSTPNFQGLLGRVTGFSSEKENKCSFAAWAETFEENARLRGMPEDQWAPYAKTNLAGKARERWLQAESTLPPDAAKDWNVFKGTLTPLFADADKKAKARQAYSLLETRGCQVHTAQGLRDYSGHFLTTWADLGTPRTVTEEGAIETYLKGLPPVAKSMAHLLGTVQPGLFANLEEAVLNTTNFGAAAMEKGTQLDEHVGRGQKRPSNDHGAETSRQGSMRPRGGKQPRNGRGQAGHGFAGRVSKVTKAPRPQRPDTRSAEELLADWTIRGYTDREDGRLWYSPELARVLMEQERCLGCRQKGHKISECTNNNVPASAKQKYAQKN